ncbi:Solute carrier family 13 member 1 [Pteropus alecto]|uniref:Solute carrier family 13 member 1 n=1 Tax=Pteropus alecto TaxID=9402 RepID=L5KRR9_PTEAL|nr:Solute carrier family 13 member 1 [Pteropus alecto]
MRTEDSEWERSGVLRVTLHVSSAEHCLDTVSEKPQRNPSVQKPFPFTLPHTEIPTVSIHVSKMSFLRRAAEAPSGDLLKAPPKCVFTLLILLPLPIILRNKQVPWLHAFEVVKTGYEYDIVKCGLRKLENVSYGELAYAAELGVRFIGQIKEAECAYTLFVVAVFWLTEALPLSVTALLPGLMFPLFGIMPSKKVASAYFKDFHLLLIGVICLATSIEKWNLHKRIALRMVMMVGVNPACNTSTTAMVMPIVEAVAQQIISAEAEVEATQMTYFSGSTNHGLEIDAPKFLLIELQSSDIDNNNNNFAIVIAAAATDGNNCMLVLKMINIQQFLRFQELIKEYSYLRVRFLCSILRKEMFSITRHISFSLLHIAQTLAELSTSAWNKSGGKKQMLVRMWRKRNPCKSMQSLWKTVWRFLKNLKTELPYDPVISLFGIYPKEIINTVTGTKYRTKKDHMMCKLMCLCIAYSSTIGGLTTITGTSTNLIFAEHFNMRYPECHCINFGSWFMLSFPAAVVILLLSWIWLQWLFLGFKYPGFATDSTVALLVGLLFFLIPAKILTKTTPAGEIVAFDYSPLITWKEFQSFMPWNIAILVGGGFALADGCEESGLSKWIGNKLSPLGSLPLWLIILISSLLVTSLTEVASNPATITLLLPILSPLAEAIHVNPLYILIPSTLCTSFAFLLPVANPPNAIVFSYGHLKVIDMVKAGLGVNIVGVAVVMLGMFTWIVPIFDLNSYPSWAPSISNDTGP